MKTERSEDVLRFWFPSRPSGDLAAMVRQWEWWFRRGADAYVTEHFSPLLERATRGELYAWSGEPRSHGGHHPHRNEILERRSIPEELEYLASGQLVHMRSMPPHLSQFLSNT